MPNPFRSKWVLLGGALSALGGLVLVSVFWTDPLPTSAETIHASAALAVPAPVATSVAAPARSIRTLASRGTGPAIEKFQAKFGTELKVELSSDGRLESARGFPGAGTRGATDFSPDDPQKAISRAREILTAARDAMGIEVDRPLGLPVAKSSATSAQVFFRETIEGVPLAPVGSVTVDLGPQGELLGLHSDYLPGIHVTNERTRTSEELLKTAASAVPGVTSAIKPSGGSPVIWVASSADGNSAEGRHAYEYQVQGHQVIVDASSGEVLRRRDHRDF